MLSQVDKLDMSKQDDAGSSVTESGPPDPSKSLPWQNQEIASSLMDIDKQNSGTHRLLGSKATSKESSGLGGKQSVADKKPALQERQPAALIGNRLLLMAVLAAALCTASMATILLLLSFRGEFTRRFSSVVTCAGQ